MNRNGGAVRVRAAVVACATFLAFAAAAAAGDATYVSPSVVPGVFAGDVRDLPVVAPPQPGDPVTEAPRRRITHEAAAPTSQSSGAVDPLLSQQTSTRSATRTFTTTDVNVAGVGFTSVEPPDTIGDVGLNYYVQAINGSTGTNVLVLDKTSGATVAGPFILDSLFSGTGACNTGGGDPSVLYDQLADRWLLAEFASSGNHLCVYISKTNSPIAGGWYSYDFPLSEFPDYPKFAVWPTAYFATTNESQPAVYAFDRAAMLTGAAATYQRKTGSVLSGFGFQAFTPADLDGFGVAPAVSPAFFLRHRDDEVHNPGSNDPGSDFIEVWGYSVDFTTPANSSFTQLADIPVSEFDSDLCGLSSTSCFSQPLTTQTLDPLREIIMNRVQYRNFGTHQTLVGSFVTDVDGSDHGGVRWFELRRTGHGAWSLHQEGTYAPDANDRWDSSIAMDGSGNLALGYSVTGSATFPGIRYVGRKAGDTLGTMTTGEVTMRAGGGSQAGERWGDYSAMSVDPVNNCRFWYTNEYVPAGGLWATRIASFRFDAPDCVDSPAPSCGNNIAESGEDCDGTDDGACAGLCQGGCTCPAPSCGNNVLEVGETCDGTDDDACPGNCDAGCACPATCDLSDVHVLSARANDVVYRWNFTVDNLDGAWNGIDPRNAFTFVVSQGATTITTDIPPTVGWEKSRPDRGRYLWMGDVNGVTRVKVLDQTARKGVLRVMVRGKSVPDAGSLDIVNFYANVQLTMDGQCGGGVY